VPPELDFSKPKAAEPPLKSKSVLILETLPGAALLADRDGKIVAATDGWDEAMTRAARSDLSRNALLGRPFLNLLPEEGQREEFTSALPDLLAERPKKCSITAELGTASKPFAMNFAVHAMKDEGQFSAFLIQGTDVTQDLVTRMALLDRERRLRELRTIAERQNAELAALKQREEQAESEKTATLAKQTEQINDLYTQIAQVTSQKEVVIARQIEEIASLQQQIAQISSQKDNTTSQQSEEILQLREQIDLILSQKEAQAAAHAEETAALKELSRKIAGQRDELLERALGAFSVAPQNFGTSLCQIAQNLTNAASAELVIYSPDDQSWGASPAGMAAQNHCAQKFDHLMTRSEFEAWAPQFEKHGWNCLWVFPIEDADGLCGVLQLGFEKEDVALPVEQYSVIAAAGPVLGPLIRAWQHWPQAQAMPVEPEIETATSNHNGTGKENFRVLAAGLSEEFANLLTGVLGHSSLVASEMGDGHRALDDVRAIERSARHAAKLTRRLSALSGAAHRNAAPVELTTFLPHYVNRDRADYFSSGPAELNLPEGSCTVHAESAALEIILDGMADHARNSASSSASPGWSVKSEEGSAVLTLCYEGPAAIPMGWDDPQLKPHPHQQMPELFFAREAAGALGGTLELCEQGTSANLILTLPMIRVSKSLTAS
jgi:hypothetical protein